MKTKEEAIQVIKNLIKDNDDFGLDLGEIGSAKWGEKKLMDSVDFNKGKTVGYVSAISWAFDITPEDVNNGEN